jgi:hypothetical protein
MQTLAEKLREHARLLDGTDAPHLPQESVDLMREAADKLDQDEALPPVLYADLGLSEEELSEALAKPRTFITVAKPEAYQVLPRERDLLFTCEVIEHAQQRYETCGDWLLEAGSINVRVSYLGDWRMELLVGVHELIEAALCKHRGITDEAVTAFDEQFERDRAEGKHKLVDEPGNDPRASYFKEHLFASMIERDLAAELSVKWDEYEKRIQEL